MKKATITALLALPVLLTAGGNPGNPLRTFTVEDTVRWVLTGVELGYNHGSAKDILACFAPAYSDVNEATFTKIGAMLPRLLSSVKEGDKPFMFYNASVKASGTNAVLTATILIRPTGVSVGGQGLLVARDTIALTRLNGKWLIKSAPRLVAAFRDAAIVDSFYRVKLGVNNETR